MVQVETRRRTRLTSTAQYDGSPSWSPGGTRLAFISGRDGYDAGLSCLRSPQPAAYAHSVRRHFTLRPQACMIELRDKATNELLGTIVDEELRFLVDELEEESQTDRDYYLDAATIDMLEADGAPLNLVSLLRRVLGSREGIDVRWVRV